MKDRPTVTRRALLGSAAVAAASGVLPWPLRAADPAPDAKRVAEDIYLLRGAGANVLIRTGADGALLVDGGLERHADDVLAAVRELGGDARVRVLFNTHWHPVATGLNRRLGAGGTDIVAHENTRLWLSTEVRRPWDEEPHAPLPPEARPNRAFHRDGTLEFDGEPVHYGYLLQAYTDGDIYVHLPRQDVLATGAVGAADRWPDLDWWSGGWLGGTIDALDRLLEVASDDTVIVPAFGPAVSRADLAGQREMYVTVFERLVDMLMSGHSADEAVAAAPTREFDAGRGDPARFIAHAFRGLGLHFAPDA